MTGAGKHEDKGSDPSDRRTALMVCRLRLVQKMPDHIDKELPAFALGSQGNTESE